MKHLQALLALITAALTRGGTGAARHEAQEEILRMARQGMRMAQEMITANVADFARHFEGWFGIPPTPPTPREDPQHAALARIGRIAVWFLLALKAFFWIVFGPSYFNVLAWLAIIIALCISIPMSAGLKSLIARLILKPGLTIQEQERRLHRHVLAGIISFGIVFGGLFLLRGLVGSLALLGAMLVLPILSMCDMVLLYLMGIADAYAHLYGWAAPFVTQHHALTTYLGQFEHHAAAAQQRLAPAAENTNGSTTIITPELPASTNAGNAQPDHNGIAATRTPHLVEPPTDNTTGQGATGSLHGITGTAALIMIGLFLGTGEAHAQHQPTTTITLAAPAAATANEPATISTLHLDGTTSVFPGVATTMGPMIAQAFTTWSEQLEAHMVRVTTFERDGWFPRVILQTIQTTPRTCSPPKGEHGIFKGITEALEEQTRTECNNARAQQAGKLATQITNAMTTAWNATPIAKQGRSCTAFRDLLASTARLPVGNLAVIVSDTEETCKNDTNPVPARSAGAEVIIILVPSKADMGHGVSAADRFTTKSTALAKIAPWIRAILAPADVELYQLPARSTPPPRVTTIGFWQR